MSENIKTAAFIGGELVFLEDASKSKDVVLAVPLSRVLSKFIFLPSDTEQSLEETSQSCLDDISPYPDEELTLTYETCMELEKGKMMYVAALPESAAEDIGELLDAHKLNVVRIDALPIGAIRVAWPKLSERLSSSKRSVFIWYSVDGFSLFVFDGQMPVVVSSFGEGSPIMHELILSLMQAEDAFGVAKLETIFVSGFDGSQLSEMAEVVDIGEITTQEVLKAISERTDERDCIDLSPASWREVLAETRFKQKLKKRLAIAGGIWAIIVGVLFGVPAVYGMMSDYRTNLMKEHRKAYNEASELKKKVDLIRKYSNHDNGALEAMRTVSENLPDEGDGFIVTSYDFRRGESMRVSGEADERTMIFDFKDKLSVCGFFENVSSPSDKKSRDRHVFTIDMSMMADQDENSEALK
ncbi:MAG: hypothetical protein J6S51_01565 [Kiritimatiellae bacterium]|nr:hypothetical protein [Kiritimatiellia bacterium]